MQELLNRAENERVVFVEDFKDLEFVNDISSKKLCIIKTDFKNINQIKKFCKNYPELEVWLASADISRKNILAANSCGVKNVVHYPVETKLIHEFFKKKEQSSIQHNQYNNNTFLKDLKVMIVDDNKMNIDLLVETLSQMGLQISTFIKPIEASKVVHIEKFDLFLLDIMMPEMSGFDLAREIRNTTLNANTPIMFISALCDPDNKIKSYNLGSCAYIEKPFNINVVRSQIYNNLKTKRLQDALYDRKDTFLAMITHDLKTPVSAEICALELLLDNQDSSLDSFQNEIVNDLLSAAKYMKILIDNILSKYKHDNGNIILNKEKFSFKLLIAECIEEIKYIFQDKNQMISFNCNLESSDVYIDYTEIKRVIHNLLINANEHGSRNTKIELELTDFTNNYVFSVTNYGKGIRALQPTDIFEKDFTCNSQNKNAGTGLGLYISKKIIDMHNGSITVETEIDKYAKISFSIPKS